MIALSIRQPWAWLILNGFKDIENRDWFTRQRGPVLIHAGKVLDRDAAEDLWRGIHPVIGGAWPFPVPRSFALGGIVGEVDIVDCVTEHPSDWFVGRFGFVLANPRKLSFRPCRGQLGFFRPEIEEVEAVSTAQGSLL